MRRTLLSIAAAALLPAASVWAAPEAAVPSADYLNQINDQAFQIQVQASRLEGYLRSGAHDAPYAAGYTLDIADGTRRLAVLLDQFVAQPGTTNDTRQQVERMKVAVTELGAFAGNGFQNIDSHAMGLHLDEILASVSNIMDRGNMLRATAHTLANAN
jgi:hypothetical protein